MHVRWTKAAVADLTHICDYIEGRENAAVARRIANEIYSSIGKIAYFPSRGRSGRKRGTRELMVPGLPYLAIYRLQEDAVEILRILHGAQRWPA